MPVSANAGWWYTPSARIQAAQRLSMVPNGITSTQASNSSNWAQRRSGALDLAIPRVDDRV
jgi:hypothetical protein